MEENKRAYEAREASGRPRCERRGGDVIPADPKAIIFRQCARSITIMKGPGICAQVVEREGEAFRGEDDRKLGTSRVEQHLLQL